MMKCSKTGFLRFLDMVALALVFLFQNVTLNYIIIWHQSASIYSFMWFLGDFFGLLLFSFAAFLSHVYHKKTSEKERRSASRASYASAVQGSPRSGTPQGSEASDDCGYLSSPMLGPVSCKLSFTWISWLFYSCLLIMKIGVLFKFGIAQKLPRDDILGPQMMKFCIGLSTIVFSLLTECHHNARDEPLRNAYLSSVAFGVALEILDSVSFLTLLIPSEGHLSYTFNMENYIIALASVNLMLPAITIWKISSSNFGRVYNVPVETLYKFLHLFLVNLPFLGFRIYFWQAFSTDTAIFMIKNVYAIIAFIRGIYPDLKALKGILHTEIQRRKLLKAAAAMVERTSSGSSLPLSKNGSNGHIQVYYRNERSSPKLVAASTSRTAH